MGPIGAGAAQGPADGTGMACRASGGAPAPATRTPSRGFAAQPAIISLVALR